MRRAIVNVAVGYWYPHGQHRLDVSLDTVGELEPDRLFWPGLDPDIWPNGCPTHSEINYGFKVWALRQAQAAGYDQALWIDSSCWAIRPLAEVWDVVDAVGCYLEPDGHILGEWISDRALQGLRELGYTRDKCFALPLPEGKLIGVDFRHERTAKWLAMLEAKLDLFNGPWSNENGKASADARCRGHRHDIAIGGVLADRMQLTFQPVKRIGMPVARTAPASSTVLLAEGLSCW